ncbi:hypothetical protein V1227_06205 [Lentzea sp. DG1S-22]|uniref:hypothetical protein n=1 Tax=Lentzea sp. DG1S-22 TaxID=3108822 RepID=UPI002E771A71|nr:hypothetical protein [Lentzea sp. DG1S-22]WVH82345.1 hypothetical protein V1227_06205 [Lentzea sp. DG1S-22]
MVVGLDFSTPARTLEVVEPLAAGRRTLALAPRDLALVVDEHPAVAGVVVELGETR